MTFRLGIIDKEFRDTLHIIRKIRNDFAHQLIKGSLENPPYSDRIDTLYCGIKTFWKYVNPFSELFQNLQKVTETIADNITQYKIAAFFLIIRLEEISKIDKLLYLQKPKKIIPKWVRNIQDKKNKLVSDHDKLIKKYCTLIFLMAGSFITPMVSY